MPGNDGEDEKVAERSQIIKTAAGIVTYNPEIRRLQNNINAIHNQVSLVYCFDNGSVNLREIKEICGQYDNVIVFENGENSGIAEGLNQIISEARRNGVVWLLTLDQDSVCPTGMIEKMLQYADKPNIVAICPRVVDHRRPVEKQKEDGVNEIDFCITSGCLVNTMESKKIGDFDSWLFIGQVDDEFCHRAMINDKKILRINSLELDHELGELRPSRFQKIFLRLGEILHFSKLKALSYKRKVSPMRVYYSTRNMVYLSRKYRNYPNTKFTRKRAIFNAISNVIRGQKRIETAKAAIRGYKEGYSVTVKVYTKE